MHEKGIAKNTPTKPSIDPKIKTEYKITKGWSPNFSPIILGDRKYPSSKKEIINIKKIIKI